MFQIKERLTEDGRRLMLIITSNAYKDREEEIIKERALGLWVDSQWEGDQYIGDNPLLVWHGGDPIGQIIFSDMEGPFLVEVAKEGDPDKLINLALPEEEPIQTTIKAVWDGLESMDDNGASHLFRFLEGDEKDKTYDLIVKEETSVLPIAAAANPYTTAIIKETDMRRNTFIDRLLGGGKSEEIKAAVEETKATLDKLGVQRKEGDPVMVEEEEEVKADDPLAAIIERARAEGIDIPEKLAIIIAETLSDEGEEAMLEVEEEEEGVKALTDFVNDILADSAELAAEQARMAKELKALADRDQSRAKELTALKELVKSFEKQLGGRPRRASQDRATRFEAPEVEQEIKKSLGEEDSYAEIRAWMQGQG